MSVRACGGQRSPARGPALASPSRACPRPRQHLALPVDADVVGVLPARCPVHHSCGSFCVEVETLGQAVEGTGFHTPWERSRGSNDAAKDSEERCGETDLDNGCLTLSLPTPPSCTWPTAQLQVPTRMSLLSGGTHGGTQTPSLLISTESRPLNWTLTHGETLSLLHSVGNTGCM